MVVLISVFFLVMLGCTITSPIPRQIDLLQRLPLHTVSIHGNRIVYLDEGEGRPLILIHGFGGAIWNWEHQQHDLAQSYRVITLDLLGSGLSAKPHIAYTPVALLNFFLDFMDHLGLEQAVLIGNSIGAGLAMSMALQHPDRVASLVLITGLPAHIQDSLVSAQHKAFLESRPPLWLAKMGNWFLGRWLSKKVLSKVIHNPYRLTSLVIERSYQNRSTPGFLHALFSLADHLGEWEQNFAPRISSITHPTLILWGSEDGVFPPSVGETLHRMIPHSVLKIISDSGHMPQWENPLQVNQAIRQFLATPVP
ncbi:MAG: alpha/beta fold hydrolase [Nitrospirales bacterium]|nr:alpha/beta fold hydrolase [Nitrospirales bacterium]